MEAKEILKRYFGYDSFKYGQEEIIKDILDGKDILAIMPTGAGKSICYQVPSILLKGITLVISPLISLMQDQVKALNEAGIHSGYINSSLTEAQISKVYANALAGMYKILYAAPERLENDAFMRFANSIDISMITVDEAHCISQWGQDFRPSYLKIVDFIDRLSQRPIISAFTATATEEVKADIVRVLKLQNPKVLTTGFDRENLYFKVETTRLKDDYVLEYIKKHSNESGIVYCATRKNVDSLFERLISAGVLASRYHAGMTNHERKINQNDFIYDRTTVIVATNAFGMGIDKSNVRFVIHYNMPQSMENYYQEAGRGGRDGEDAECILLFSEQDIIINKFLLDHKNFSEIPYEDIDFIRKRDIKRLQMMEGYCRTSKCLRNYILEYFGEKRDKPCDNCGNCHGDYDEIDMTEDAKLVIDCVKEAQGKYGQRLIVDTLLGSQKSRLKALGMTHYVTYGALKSRSDFELRLLISQMLLDGYLYRTSDRYSVIRIGNVEPINDPNFRVVIKKHHDTESAHRVKKQSKNSTKLLTNAENELFETLRQLRLTIAREENVPPYIIFNDKTLKDMTIKRPLDKRSMLNVSGVGEAKYEKYGPRFIEEINLFIDEHPDINIYNKEKRLRTKHKNPFYLNPEDKDKFEYHELCAISDIRKKMNQITSGHHVKRLHGRDIVKLLKEKGYVEDRQIEGRDVQIQTELGLANGVVTVEKISRSGNPYKVLMCSPKIQKEIVEHFVEQKERITLDGDTKDENGIEITFDRVAYNRKMSRPDGAGAPWTNEEDMQLDKEYLSGMKIAKIAEAHDRTYGAIRSRLKKHGLIT